MTDDSFDVALAHGLLRFGLGVNFFMHGLARLPKLGGFVQHTMATMAGTPLPPTLVIAIAYAIPFVELLLGMMLILGLLLRATLVAGLLFMSLLTCGICLAQNWSVASEQLIYMVVLALLLAGMRFNRYSLGQARGQT